MLMSTKTGLAPTERRKTTKQPNQWTGNPKQEKCIALYLDPTKPDTFGNMYASAIAAGYAETYARVIASPSIGNLWIQEYKNRAQFTPEHITQGIVQIALTGRKESDRLRAFELLAKLQGLLVDKSITAHVNIEQALQELR